MGAYPPGYCGEGVKIKQCPGGSCQVTVPDFAQVRRYIYAGRAIGRAGRAVYSGAAEYGMVSAVPG
ncbi:hypothetical protein ES708_16470 [subsurface metagenome]